MAKVAGSTEEYFTQRHIKGTNDGTNNHYYWAGFAVMAAGIAADDRKLFDWGVSTYNEAMSRIQPDGTLPLEMARGQRALHYHVFALAPLTMMAEMGYANGLDLYNANNGALKRLIDVTAAGLVTGYAGEIRIEKRGCNLARALSESLSRRQPEPAAPLGHAQAIRLSWRVSARLAHSNQFEADRHYAF
jgi:hypothetical protein